MTNNMAPQSLDAIARLARSRPLATHYAKALAVLILIVGGLDAVSTELALGTNMAREANPVVRWMQDILGVYWIAPKMALHGAMAWMGIWYPNWPTLIALSMVSVLAALAALNNFHIYAQAMAIG